MWALASFVVGSIRCCVSMTSVLAIGLGDGPITTVAPPQTTTTTTTTMTAVGRTAMGLTMTTQIAVSIVGLCVTARVASTLCVSAALQVRADTQLQSLSSSRPPLLFGESALACSRIRLAVVGGSVVVLACVVVVPVVACQLCKLWCRSAVRRCQLLRLKSGFGDLRSRPMARSQSVKRGLIVTVQCLLHLSVGVPVGLAKRSRSRSQNLLLARCVQLAPVQHLAVAMKVPLQQLALLASVVIVVLTCSRTATMASSMRRWRPFATIVPGVMTRTVLLAVAVQQPVQVVVILAAVVFATIVLAAITRTALLAVAVWLAHRRHLWQQPVQEVVILAVVVSLLAVVMLSARLAVRPWRMIRAVSQTVTTYSIQSGRIAIVGIGQSEAGCCLALLAALMTILKKATAMMALTARRRRRVRECRVRHRDAFISGRMPTMRRSTLHYWRHWRQAVVVRACQAVAGSCTSTSLVLIRGQRGVSTVVTRCARRISSRIFVRPRERVQLPSTGGMLHPVVALEVLRCGFMTGLVQIVSAGVSLRRCWRVRRRCALCSSSSSFRSCGVRSWGGVSSGRSGPMSWPQ